MDIELNKRIVKLEKEVTKLKRKISGVKTKGSPYDLNYINKIRKRI